MAHFEKPDKQILSVYVIDDDPVYYELGWDLPGRRKGHREPSSRFSSQPRKERRR